MCTIPYRCTKSHVGFYAYGILDAPHHDDHDDHDDDDDHNYDGTDIWTGQTRRHVLLFQSWMIMIWALGPIHDFFQKSKVLAGEIDRFDRFQRCEYWFGMLGRGCTWGGKLFNEYTQELIRENRAITRKVWKEETWLGTHETCFDCW